MMRRWMLLLMVALLWAVPALAQDADGALSVLYREGNTLYRWDEAGGETEAIFTENPLNAWLSPDGVRVLVTAGAEGVPTELWLIENGEAALLATSEADLGGGLFRSVVWADADTFYFNTTAVETVVGLTPANDLWRGDATTGEIALVLEPGVGGAFVAGPGGRWLAVSTPGTFTQAGTPDEDGVLRLYDTTTGETRIVLGYTAIATGSPMPFHPRVRWEPGGAALLTAIPPTDAIYQFGMDNTNLWRVPVEGEPEPLGGVTARFFGAPRFSVDGTQMLYSRDDAANQVALVLANVDGSGEAVITVSAAVSFFWTDAPGVFVWSADDATWLGTGDDPRGTDLGSGVFSLQVAGDWLIYLADGGQVMEAIRVTATEPPTPQRIVEAGADTLILDAKIIQTEG